MDKISRSLIYSLAIILALAACGPAEETQAPDATSPGIRFSITGSDCPSVEISANDQITWVNEGAVDHPDGEPMVDLGVLQPSDSASVTFPQASSFTYTCTEDRASAGIITVQP